MTSGSDTQLQTIDQTTLTPLVRRALGSESAEVTSWDWRGIHQDVGYGNVGGTAIYRFAGVGRDGDRTVDWSLILKVFRPPGDRGTSSDWNYWRREVDVYQSGWLDDLPGGLAAPRCFGVAERPNGECWIWMEEVRDDMGPKWPLEHYGVVARHLGQFNGAYLMGHALPSWPWLSWGWLRGGVAHAAPSIRQLRNSREHPIVRRCYPPDVADGIFRLWAEREVFLDALDHMPQTLCHFDAFPRNLFTRRTAGGGEQILAVDWAFVGRGAIGEDMMPLVQSTLTWDEVDRSEALKLDRVVYEGYLDGLCEAGWRGDPRQVRLGYSASAAMRVLVSFAQALPVLLDESRYAWVEQVFGCPIGEMADRWAERQRHPPLDWVGEARKLLLALGYAGGGESSTR